MADRFGDPNREVTAASGVVVADESANGKLLLQCQSAEAIIHLVFAIEPPEVGKSVAAEGSAICRLRRDLFFISTGPADARGIQARLQTATPPDSPSFHFTVTDVTHGRCELRLVGPRSRELLSKVCALDFHSGRFADGDVRETSVAKTKQLVIRRDIGEETSFSIIGGRSTGAYLWDILLQAGAEFALVPIGREAIARIETST